MQRVRTALLDLAFEEPSIRAVVVPLAKQALGWDKLPKGWTQESVDKFWGKLTGDAKHKVTKCIERMKGKPGFEDPGAFCASLADQVEGSTDWRKGPRKDKKANGDMLQYFADNPDKLAEKIERDKAKAARKKHKTAARTVDLKIGVLQLHEDPGDTVDHTDNLKVQRASSVRDACAQMERLLKQYRDLNRRLIGAGGNWKLDRKGRPAYTMKIDRSHSTGIYGVDTWAFDTWTVTLDFSSEGKKFPPALMARVMHYLQTGKIKPPARSNQRPEKVVRDIRLTYSTIDRFRKSARFKTLKGAQKFAHKWVGETPDIGGGYAVTFDGVGKLTWRGVTPEELFPKLGGRYASRTALNRYNAPEMLSALLKSLSVAGLDETVDELRRLKVPRLVNDAWMNREK